jgi:hypothetical protein
MLSLIVDGSTEYPLDDGTYGLLVGYDGWGQSPSNRISSQGPQQHGSTDEGQFLQPRFGTLLFLVPNTELSDMYDAREPLLELFHPDNSLALKWDLDKGIRYFDCFYSGDLTMPWKPNSWGNLRVAITLKCPDPTCYDPTVNVDTWIGSSGTSFQVPWVVPTFVGGSTIDQNKVIQYAGTWFEYPEITIDGPITDPVITNLENNYKLDFTGLTLGLNESRIIDLRYAYKTVLDESGGNQIQDLTSDSDLATWRLERKRVYDTSRNNTVHVSATGVSSSTRVLVRWKERHVGL